MNIKTVGFAFIVVAVTAGYAGAVDTDRQKTVQGIDTVQGTDTVQATDTVQGTDAAQGTDTVQGSDTVQDTDTVQGTETVQGTNNDSYDPDEVTCKRIAKVGTRFKTRVCATNREWKISEENAKRTMEKIHRRPQHGRDSG